MNWLMVINWLQDREQDRLGPVYELILHIPAALTSPAELLPWQHLCKYNIGTSVWAINPVSNV